MTKDIFKAFEDMRLSGRYNIITDADNAMTAMGLDCADYEQRKLYADVVNNYSKYYDMYVEADVAG